ncbi:MAG: nucleotidyltransferase domain-containing protein [Ignavibacteriaceae bacterium]
MTINNFYIKENDLKDICKRYSIKELSLFGSVLRNDFNSASDIDLLYVFENNTRYSLFDMVQIKEDFEKFFERSVEV